MATGAQHYEVAEALLQHADALRSHEDDSLVQAAQVHATLALAAATATATRYAHGTDDGGYGR